MKLLHLNRLTNFRHWQLDAVQAILAQSHLSPYHYLVDPPPASPHLGLRATYNIAIHASKVYTMKEDCRPEVQVEDEVVAATVREFRASVRARQFYACAMTVQKTTTREHLRRLLFDDVTLMVDLISGIPDNF